MAVQRHPWRPAPVAPVGGRLMAGRDSDLTVAAARRLVDRGLMGVVSVDRNGIVADCQGSLVDWVSTGQRALDRMPFLAEHEQSLAAVAEGRRSELFLTGVRRPGDTDDNQPAFSVHCFPAKEASGVVLVFQDSTTLGRLERSVQQQRSDLVLAERRLTHAQEIAKAANQARSLFLANVSHELRTPLNVIIGNAEILRDWDPATFPAEDLQTFAEDILDNGTFLLDHINDLLDLAKAELGGIDLVEEDVDVELVIEGAVSAVRKLPSAGSLTIRHKPATSLPRLIGDPQRLRQIILNLLGDAVRVTPNGGEVSVRAFTAEDGSLTIEISDDGTGITEASRDGVLQPFAQADMAADNRARSDSGLGLPLAKTLIELHDGTLALDSNPGKGTCLTLKFPPKRTQAVA